MEASAIIEDIRVGKERIIITGMNEGVDTAVGKNDGEYFANDLCV